MPRLDLDTAELDAAIERLRTLILDPSSVAEGGRRRDDPSVQDNLVLVCGECILEWAAVTNSDYVQRCPHPAPEFPEP